MGWSKLQILAQDVAALDDLHQAEISGLMEIARNTKACDLLQALRGQERAAK